MLSSFDKIRDKILSETFLKQIKTKSLRRKYTKIYKIFKIDKTFNSANHSWLYYSRLGQVKEVILFEKQGGGEVNGTLFQFCHIAKSFFQCFCCIIPQVTLRDPNWIWEKNKDIFLIFYSDKDVWRLQWIGHATIYIEGYFKWCQ